ncbi:MAG: hypothetical protein MHM6MM_006578 [Cercozoa sp. M6MM]
MSEKESFVQDIYGRKLVLRILREKDASLTVSLCRVEETHPRGDVTWYIAASAGLLSMCWVVGLAGDWSVVVAALVAVAVLLKITIEKRAVFEERIIVMRQVGVQFESVTKGGSVKRTFLDDTAVKSVVLNEGVSMCRVLSYLAFRVHGQDKMKLAFENLWPRYSTLVSLYAELKRFFPNQHAFVYAADAVRHGRSSH